MSDNSLPYLTTSEFIHLFVDKDDCKFNSSFRSERTKLILSYLDNYFFNFTQNDLSIILISISKHFYFHEEQNEVKTVLKKLFTDKDLNFDYESFNLLFSQPEIITRFLFNFFNETQFNMGREKYFKHLLNYVLDNKRKHFLSSISILSSLENDNIEFEDLVEFISSLFFYVKFNNCDNDIEMINSFISNKDFYLFMEDHFSDNMLTLLIKDIPNFIKPSSIVNF